MATSVLAMPSRRNHGQSIKSTQLQYIFPGYPDEPILPSLDAQRSLCLLVLKDAASGTSNRLEQTAYSVADLANKTIDSILGTSHDVIGHFFDTADETVGRVLDLGHGGGGIVDEATDSAGNVTLRTN